jgi:hypothetical protein
VISLGFQSASCQRVVYFDLFKLGDKILVYLIFQFNQIHMNMVYNRLIKPQIFESDKYRIVERYAHSIEI